MEEKIKKEVEELNKVIKPVKSIKKLKEIVIPMIKADVPLMIWGPPGVGKTQVAKELSVELFGKPARVISLSVTSFGDMGLNYPNQSEKVLDYFVAKILVPEDPNEERILVLDELNNAHPMIQAQAFHIILDRQLGEHKLSPGWRIIATGNRSYDRSVVQPMPSPLVTRMSHFEVLPNADDFIEYALDRGLDPMIIEFLRIFKQYIFQEPDTFVEGEGAASPRTYEMLSKVLRYGDMHDLTLIISVIGSWAGYPFYRFINLTSKVPNPNDVIEGKDPVFNVQDNDAIYAFIGSLARTLREKPSEKGFLNVFKYAVKHFDPDFQVKAIIDIWRAIGIGKIDLTKVPEFTQWAIKNAPYILGQTGGWKDISY
jgi:DNA polymerase III delta prime subunit